MEFTDVTHTPHKERDTESNDVVISAETLQSLRAEEDPTKQQNILDSIFTQDRRAEMLGNASKDRHGRPVRYFRLMDYGKLLRLLEEGEQTYRSYTDDLEASVDTEHLNDLVTSIARRRAYDAGESTANISQNSTEGKINLAFQDLIPDAMLDELSHKAEAGALSYDELIRLIDTHLPTTIIQGIHSGHANQRFSPFLSLSIGGPLRAEFPPHKKTYVELTLPDESVIPDDPEHKPISKEMEVFTRKIERENIARVYTDAVVLRRDQIMNPCTAIGAYYLRLGDAQEAVDEWRFNEDTDDYLPSSLVTIQK